MSACLHSLFVCIAFWYSLKLILLNGVKCKKQPKQYMNNNWKKDLSLTGCFQFYAWYILYLFKDCLHTVHFSRHGLIMSDFLWPHWNMQIVAPVIFSMYALIPTCWIGLLAVVPKFYLYSFNESSLFKAINSGYWVLLLIFNQGIIMLCAMTWKVCQGPHE